MAKKSKTKMLMDDIQSSIRGMFSDEIELSDYDEFMPHVKRAIAHKDNLLDCAKRFGTPIYVLDEGMLAGQAYGIMKAFRRHLSKVSVFYAFKSNDLPYLLQKLKDIGVNADVSSRAAVDAQVAAKLAERAAAAKVDKKAKADAVAKAMPGHLADRLVERRNWTEPSLGTDATFGTSTVELNYRSFTPGQARWLAAQLRSLADKAERYDE